MTERPVLILTCLDDPTADVVITALNDRGVPVVRCDPADLLTGGLTLAAHYHDRGPVGFLRTASRELDLSAVRSVYYRRPSPYKAPDTMRAQDGWFAAEQARFGLGGVLSSLRCRWVNHIWSSVGAEYKPTQLATATQCGLIPPPTLITNLPAEVHEFFDLHQEVVYKPLHPTELRDHTGALETIWVRPVDPTELDETIALTAHQFQARVVGKVADVRTTVIGERVYSVRIDSPNVDWRSDYSTVAYSVTETPRQVVQACHAYLEHFGLLFGAFDFGIGPDGTWQFYECNTAGQWHWLEQETGLPMTAALVDLLEGNR